jgi:hypothetical protein
MTLSHIRFNGSIPVSMSNEGDSKIASLSLTTKVAYEKAETLTTLKHFAFIRKPAACGGGLTTYHYILYIMSHNTTRGFR